MALVRPRSKVLTARIGVRYRTAFRVGINPGDAVVDDKDLYGDGIKIAARLDTAGEALSVS
jgi:class 3 adenylate cyclase